MGNQLNTFCTTVLVKQGVVQWWPLHSMRLKFCASKLCVDVDTVAIEKELESYYSGVVRIEVNFEGQHQLVFRRLPTYKQDWSIHWTVRDTMQDFKVKWVDRTRWDLLKLQHTVDLLGFLDENGRYLETCIGNLFVYRPSEQIWYTAPNTSSILIGTMRSVIMVALKNAGEQVCESMTKRLPQDEVWMCNAVRGFVSIGSTTSSKSKINSIKIPLNDNRDVLQHFADSHENLG